MNRLFPTDLPERQWLSFNAHGFAEKACGVTYRDRSSPAVCGVPLGGVDTGCLDLETSGLWGYSSIFNSLVPRLGPVNIPVLGLAVDGQTWVLTTGRTKSLEADSSATDREEPVYGRLDLPDEMLVRDIHYWGHYPVSDLEFELDGPVGVGLRAWSPFLPGHLEDSLTPGIVLEVHLRNPTADRHACTLAISFPGPTEDELGGGAIFRDPVDGAVTGVRTGTTDASYVLGVVAEHEARIGGALNADGEFWSQIDRSLPEPGGEDREVGTSLAIDRELEPDNITVLRFVITWHSPFWRGGGHPGATDSKRFEHMYATRWVSAEQVAQQLAREHEPLLQRVLAWQQVIYTDESMPIWLRQSLVNNLHLITEDGLWAARDETELPWARAEDGLFGMNESPRACPQIECSPCSWYGSIPLVYFFPQLARSTLRGYVAYQDDEGCPTWIFGGVTMDTGPCEMTSPSRGYQVAQNPANYTDMVGRYWKRTSDDSFLEEIFPSVKRALVFTMNMNRGPDGVISFPDRRVSVPNEAFSAAPKWETEAFEWCEWHGMAAHLGGLRLAQLRIVEEMADAVGDHVFADQCRQWFAAGSKSMEERLWTGRYYLNFWDPEQGKKMDAIFAYQLDGQWMTDFHGLSPAFREDRIGTVLETVKESSGRHSPYGAVNFCQPDGSPMPPDQVFIHNRQVATDFFTPEAMMLGMTFLYRGDREFGLSLIERTLEAVELKQKRTWDQPNIINGMTGGMRFGHDYYQNLMLWSVPAAVVGQDLSGPCRSGGLVDRVIRAAAAG